MDQQSIFVVIPGYNEAKVIRQTVKEVLAEGYKVVVVDDCSTDNTKEVLNDLPVYFVRHKINLGQGAALQTGIELALKHGAEYIFTYDADGQHDCKDLAGMLDLMYHKKVDIIFASRFLAGSKTNISTSRSLVLNIARYINYLVSGILLSDAYNGLRLLNKKTAGNIQILENKMAHATEFQIMVAKNKFSYAEFPNSIHYNEYSKNKGLRNRDGIKIVFEIILHKIFR